MALLGNFSKEGSFVVLLVLNIIDVDRNVDKMLFQFLNHFGVGENGRTARDAVVSDTAQRVTIHCPNEHRLFLFVGNLKAIPKSRDPTDLAPCLFRI